MAQLLLSTLATITEQKPVQETAVLIAKTLADITGVNGSAVCLVDLPQPVGNLAGEGCTHCAIKAAPNGERAPECELVINPGIYSFPLQQEGQFYGRFQVQFDNPKTASGLPPLLALFAELLTRELVRQQETRHAAPHSYPSNHTASTLLAKEHFLRQHENSHKQAEIALRQSENRYRSLFENANDAIFLLNLEGAHVVVNQKAADMLGYSKKEMIGLSYREVVVPEEIPHAQNILATLLEGKTYPTYERTFRKKNGTTFPVEINVSLLWSETGEPLYIQSIVRDITERKQAETALRQFKHAIKHSPVSVMITDVDGYIQYVNPQFSKVTGYSMAEVLGKPTRLLHSSDQPPDFFASIVKAIKAGNTWTGEIRNRRKNGDIYWDRMSIAGIKNEQGEIAHYLSVSEDVTERKRREEEHVRQERLAAVGHLAAGIAHDFNNVLSVITLYAKTLQTASNITPKQRNQLETVFQQANHAADLTRQILDFSRRSIRELRPIDLKTLLNEMMKFIERTIPERIQIYFNYEEGDYMVNADLTQLQQVITNLAVNACDAMPQGGELRIRLAPLALSAEAERPCSEMEPGNWIKLSVSDNGIGIPPEIIRHIFEPFFSTKEVGEGTGLGLAQVYGIVKQHEGCITVDSTVGQGTTFDVFLPALMRETAVSAPSSQTVQPGKGETILLVEDNDVLLEATQILLESLNYSVLTALDGVSALAIYENRSGPIHLVLADAVMPNMDGPALIKALQKHPLPPKIVMISGFAPDTIVGPDITNAISAWLPKPFNAYKLSTTLREVLD